MKRSSEGSEGKGKGSSKRHKDGVEKLDDDKPLKKDKKKAAQEIKLLSFNEDEDEEED